MISDLSGFLVIVIIYFLVLWSHKHFQDKKILFALLFVVTLHQCVAFINAYGIQTIGASVDAATFYRIAVKISNHQEAWRLASGAHLYQACLGLLFRLVGPSKLLAEELSILAFLLSCFVLIHIYKMLGYTKHVALLVLLFGSLPTMVLFGSIIMRESWQILFLLLTLYFCLRNVFYNSFVSWFGILLCAFILSLLHEGFVIFVFMLALLMVFFQVSALSNQFNHKRILSIVLTCMTSIGAFIFIRMHLNQLPELESFRALSQGSALKFMTRYHTHAMSFNPRTSFGIILDANSYFNFISTAILSFLYYMFAPFPWEISNWMDLYACLEAIGRLLLLSVAIIGFYKVDENRRQLCFLFMVYFLISLLWSLGTISYGTSIRHHLLDYGILILLFGAALDRFQFYKRPFFITTENKKMVC